MEVPNSSKARPPGGGIAKLLAEVGAGPGGKYAKMPNKFFLQDGCMQKRCYSLRITVRAHCFFLYVRQTDRERERERVKRVYGLLDCPEDKMMNHQ